MITQNSAYKLCSNLWMNPELRMCKTKSKQPAKAKITEKIFQLLLTMGQAEFEVLVQSS